MRPAGGGHPLLAHPLHFVGVDFSFRWHLAGQVLARGLADGRVPISQDTRERVLEAIEDLGYEPDAGAQALRSGSTKTIGLIIPDLNNPHFWQNADGVEQEARSAGYRLLLSRRR